MDFKDIIALLLSSPDAGSKFSERFPNAQGRHGMPYTIDSMRGPLLWPSRPGTINEQFGMTPEQLDAESKLRSGLEDAASKMRRK